MSQDSVYTRHTGAVATIHLNRPAARNALTIEMWERLLAAVETADRDTAVKVIVITGEGGAFTTGVDLGLAEDVPDDPGRGTRIADVVSEKQQRLARNVKPTIAKVRGPCIGLGCGIALCCDIRIADESAEFAMLPARAGVAPAFMDAKRLVDLIGPSRAKDMMFSARTVGALEAHAIGLVDHLEPAASLDDKVEAYADQIASMSQYSTRAIKRIVQMIMDGATQDSRDSRRLYVDAFSGADFREGLAAYREKRKPSFPVA